MPAATLRRAFVLAAGLGTRLRPLTEKLPKPLIPVGRKPLITFAFDHLIADLGVEEVMVNTHHCAGEYGKAFPEGSYRDVALKFRHEPILLETGGGVRNIQDLWGAEAGTLMVYNGDILTDLPLGPALERHRADGNEVTLVLRSTDGPKQIAWDAASGRLLDIGNRLGTNAAAGYALSCGYLLEPAFLKRIPPDVPISVIPIFVEMIRSGARIGGALADGGIWYDLGTPAEYLRAHQELHSTQPNFPRYGAPDAGWRNWIDPTAEVAEGVSLSGACVIGKDAKVGAAAELENTILWAGAEIASHARLNRCIIRADQPAGGTASDRIF